MPLLLLLACQPTQTIDVAPIPAGLELRAPGVEEVIVRDAGGATLAREALPAPVDRLRLELPWPGPGRYALAVRQGARWTERPLEVPADMPRFELLLEAPSGQGAVSVSNGDRLPVVLVDGQPAPVTLSLRARAPGEALLELGGARAAGALRPGEALSLEAEVSGPLTARARLGEEAVALALEARPVSSEDLAGRLTLRRVSFPADARGEPDIGRPEGRVSLPAAWWRRAQVATGMGARGRDPWAPWAWWGVEVANADDEPVNVSVSLIVLDEDGQPAEPFRPRLREGDDGQGALRALLRVPARGTATVALPQFVDEALLGSHEAAEGRWRHRVTLQALGARAPSDVQEGLLTVRRGSTATSLGFAGALLAAALGTLLVARRGAAWLGEAATSELMTIALFGALTFLVGVAGQVLSLGVSALLGPFAILVTGLVDDTLRYALLATLITLLPRPGTATLALITAWLLSGVALGSASPLDWLHLSGRIFFLEGALWGAGLTRQRRWLEGSYATKWLRMALAFGAASALSTLTGLALHATLLRLVYADWYVAMLVIGPGFLYEALACALAVPFAESLRGMQR